MIVQYKIIVDTQDRSHPTKNKKTYLLNIDELLTDGTDSDKLVITKDNDYVLRYFKASEFNVMSKLDTPYKEPIDIDININLFEGTNFVYIENITGEDIYAEYIIKNDFTDVYVTKNTMNSTISESIDKIELSISQKLTNYSTTEEMNSAITLKSDKINAEVRKKVGNDEVISKINQSAEKVQIDAKKISLVGKEINLTGDNTIIKSTNFNVDKDGKLTCSNANVTGTITSSNATITGGSLKVGENFSVDKDGKLTCSNANVTGTITSNNATITGNVTASNGKIAGYTINGNMLVGDNVGISGKSGEGWAFWAGSNDAGSASFRVGHDGWFYASNANIQGTITSSNATITGGSLKVGENFSVDKDGNVNVANLVTTGKGVYTNLHTVGTLYQRNNLAPGMDFFGIMENNYGGKSDVTKTQLCFFIYVPTGFVVEEAYINLTIIPIKWQWDYQGTEYWGYARNIGLYKGEIPDWDIATYASEAYSTTYNIGTKINFLSDSSNWKPENDNTLSTNHKKVSKTSKNISSEITTGNNFLIIQTDNNPSISDDKHELAEQTGKALGFLDIYGYLPR